MPDLITSSTINVNLGAQIAISPNIIARDGYLVACKILDNKEVYNQLEDTQAEFHTYKAGQVIIGTLGERQALRGYSGKVPRKITKGDTLQILNMGGIIGQSQSDYPSYGPACNVEILGAVLVKNEHEDIYKHATISDYGIEWVEYLEESVPIVAVSGTCMNVGKTYAASVITKALVEAGYTVGAAKLTGASLLRDTKSMKKNGAKYIATFTEAGMISTTGANILPMAKGIIKHLNQLKPDVIVVEFGDGVIGGYGVDTLLADKNLNQFITVNVSAAQDLTGCWALDHLFKNRFHLPVHIITGPVTDNIVGTRYIQNTIGIKAANAMTEPETLGKLVLDELGAKTA
ncbi:hypothetical protein EP331_14245 [bacterium]|nr:MAG: hypothetical protein EP331_14245 [bacterium]